MNPTETVLLLLDHQLGLFQTVKDISVAELRANAAALAKLATLLDIPVITTASAPDGPNGPLIPEIRQFVPHAIYVPRKGEVNAWDNKLFVETVRKTGKKTLIIAGVWTSVCVMFPSLDAKAAGFNVYAVMDPSGDPSQMASRTTLARFQQAGVFPTSANAVICELHRTWNRPDAAEIAELYTMVSPNYLAVMERFQSPGSHQRERADDDCVICTQQHFVAEWLRQELHSPRLHGLDCHRHVAVAVMKMIGISIQSAAMHFCRSRPLRSGRLTSSTRQLGPRIRGRARSCLTLVRNPLPLRLNPPPHCLTLMAR